MTPAWVSAAVAQAAAFVPSLTPTSTRPRAALASAVVGSGPTLTDSWPLNHGAMSARYDCLSVVAFLTSWSSASPSLVGKAAWSAKPGRALIVFASAAAWSPGRSRRTSA